MALIRNKIFYEIIREGFVLEKFVKKAIEKDYSFKSDTGDQVTVKASPERYGVLIATGECINSDGIKYCVPINYEFSKEDFDKLQPLSIVKAYMRLQNSSSELKPVKVVTGDAEILEVLDSSIMSESESDEDDEVNK